MTRTQIGRFFVYDSKVMAPISVTLTKRDPPAAVVSLLGEHDAYSSQRLENELTVLVEGGRHVVVDLRDTVFIDSTTLSALLVAQKQAEQARLGYALVLPADSDTQVHQILELTGLGATFSIYPTLDDALAAVRSRRVEDVAA
jgi:anti-anti-sigma factor